MSTILVAGTPMNIPVETIVSVLNGLGENKKVQKTILGTYSNGKTRSVIDALKGEIISPEDQLLITKRLNKKKKKKKKNKKKKKKKDMTKDMGRNKLFLN